MNHKIIKTIFITFMSCASSAMLANAQASDKGSSLTQPIVVNCCSVGGMTPTASGACSCNVNVTNIINSGDTSGAAGASNAPATPSKTMPTATGQTEHMSSIFDQLNSVGARARGDVVRIAGTFKGSLNTKRPGQIEIPQVGQIYEYEYGNTTLVIGSFNLRDPRGNQKLDLMMRRIISIAARDPKINTLIWYGRRLAGSTETVEIGESFTNATNLANVKINYRPIDATSFSFTTPASVGSQEFIVDLNPIK